jgi:hypothetical protein
MNAKTIGRVAAVVALTSLAWAAFVAAKVEDPVGNPNLLIPLLILFPTTLVWMMTLVVEESRMIGRGMATAAALVFLVLQLALYLLLR